MDLELVAGTQGGSEVALDQAPLPERGVHRLAEHDVAPAAVRLGVIERDVGLAGQLDAVQRSTGAIATPMLIPTKTWLSAGRRPADALDDPPAKRLDVLH